MGVYKLSASGGLKTGRTAYTSMLAGNPFYVDPSMELISTTILTSSVQFSFFTNIPQEYKHLQLRMSVRTDSTSADWYIAYNGENNGANNSYHYLMGNGSSVFSGNAPSNWTVIAIPELSTSPANAFGSMIVDISDYSNPNKYTTTRGFSGTTGISQVKLMGGLWRNTAPITEIRLNSGGGSAVAGTRISLYGIKG